MGNHYHKVSRDGKFPGKVEARNPAILFQSELFIAVDKPAGWLSIPGRGSLPVIHDWAQTQVGKLWVVHRLDRDTSGVLLFARDADSHRSASIWFENHQVKKSYDFVAQGTPRAPVFKSAEPIEGAASLTQFEVKEKWAQAFLGKARPTSGRRHQIRIHLSKLGFPILGDTEYGGSSRFESLSFTRVALHAASLELPTGEKIESPWHPDFKQWILDLRSQRSGEDS